ncbi:MAG: BamA/TamA family outer membrane protein [Myxococcota bacterium]|nr:BamA/TamA family outer membrane protein [Myxococcota bacterium]
MRARLRARRTGPTSPGPLASIAIVLAAFTAGPVPAAAQSTSPDPDAPSTGVEPPSPPGVGETAPEPSRDAPDGSAPGESAEPSPAPDDDPEEPVADTTRIRYFLERVRVVGNRRTLSAVVRRFVPLEPGDVLDVDDPSVETIRWRLLGTGWFDDVRLRLARGSRRGWVVLVVEVVERNTLIVRSLAAGLAQGQARTSDVDSELLPYLGVAVAETNLLGLGMHLAAEGLLSKRSYAGRLSFSSPVQRGAVLQVGGALSYHHALEFFGADDEVRTSIRCPSPEPDEPEPVCPPEVLARNAVVFYERLGLSVGWGGDLGASTTYGVDWTGELVRAPIVPDAASESVGVGPDADVEPIDFGIEPGRSALSMLSFRVVHDRRDDPALPSRGTLVRFQGDLGSRLFGSDYDLQRLQVHLAHWVRLPIGHVRLGLYGGVFFGRGPFFLRFYASDLSDQVPKRNLELNVHNPAPPDLLGTAIAEARTGDLAARLDAEYGLTLLRTSGALRAVQAYAGAGIYGLAERRMLRVAPPGYEGLARAPIDLTFDVGIRLDTAVGVFQVGFSSLIGFVTP